MEYCLIQHETSLGTKNYFSYGIRASDGSEIRDISLHKKPVEDLVKRMNEGGLALVHFKDVVENFVAAV